MVLRGWWTVALLSGASAAGLVALVATLPPGLARTSLLVGLVVFLIVLLWNPAYRYFRVFWSVLGLWSASTIIPALKLEVRAPDFVVKLLTEGPSLVLHICLAGLAGFALLLDWHERDSSRRPSVGGLRIPAIPRPWLSRLSWSSCFSPQL